MLIPHQKPTPKIRDVFFGFCNYLIRRTSNFEYLRKYLPEENYYWTSSGRNALYWILKNEKIKIVYLPSFTCHVVLDSIKRNNCKIKFIDSEHLIDINNFKEMVNASERSEFASNYRRGRAALVLPYNFGFMPDMDKIVNICKENNIILIEDCAQALGSEYKGKLAGSFGDFAFFSFGISKNIGYGNGLIVSKNKLNINEKKKYPFRKTIINLVQAKFSWIFFNRFFYSIFYFILKNRLNIRQEQLNFKASELGKYIVMQQAKRYAQILRLRKENAEYCMKKLKGTVDFIKPERNTNPSWLYFVIRDKNRDKLRLKLLKERIDVQPLLTFKDLGNGELSSKFEKEHLIFALYRNKNEIKYIINKLKCKL